MNKAITPWEIAALPLGAIGDQCKQLQHLSPEIKLDRLRINEIVALHRDAVSVVHSCVQIIDNNRTQPISIESYIAFTKAKLYADITASAIVQRVDQVRMRDLMLCRKWLQSRQHDTIQYQW